MTGPVVRYRNVHILADIITANLSQEHRGYFYNVYMSTFINVTSIVRIVSV